MDVPISLYLKTQQGEHPDLRVTARAALLFVEIIEGIAQSIDPEVQIRVELVSGSEGSLGLNTLNKIKEAASQGKQMIIRGWHKHQTLRFLTVYVAVRVLDNTLSWTQDNVMDWMASSDAPAEVQSMPLDERKELAAEIVKQLRDDPTFDKVKQLHVQVSRDSKISAIGVTSEPGPAQKLLPRSQFADLPAPDQNERTTVHQIEVTLISPVLEFGDRRWKLRGPFGEFGAAIRDKEFLRMAVSGETNLHLRGGLILDVEVAAHEKNIDGVWTVQSRTVEKVYGWREGPYQEDLIPPS